MWANGKGQVELAKRNEHEFLFHLTATSLVVVVGYEDDNDGKQQKQFLLLTQSCGQTVDFPNVRFQMQSKATM